MTLFVLISLIGIAFFAFVIYHLVRKQKSPATKAHRLAKARALWSILIHEDRHTALLDEFKTDA